MRITLCVLPLFLRRREEVPHLCGQVRQLHQPLAKSLRDRLGLRVDLQLLVNVLQVKGDRVHADAHFVRGSLLVVPVREQLQELVLLGLSGDTTLPRAGRNSRNRRTTRRATSGDIGAPPAATSCSESSRRAGGVFFNR